MFGSPQKGSLRAFHIRAVFRNMRPCRAEDQFLISKWVVEPKQCSYIHKRKRLHFGSDQWQASNEFSKFYVSRTKGECYGKGETLRKLSLQTDPEVAMHTFCVHKQRVRDSKGARTCVASILQTPQLAVNSCATSHAFAPPSNSSHEQELDRISEGLLDHIVETSEALPYPPTQEITYSAATMQAQGLISPPKISGGIISTPHSFIFAGDEEGLASFLTQFGSHMCQSLFCMQPECRCLQLYVQSGDSTCRCHSKVRWEQSIHMAIRCHHFGIVKVLINHMPELLHSKTYNDSAPLHRCIRRTSGHRGVSARAWHRRFCQNIRRLAANSQRIDSRLYTHKH